MKLNESEASKNSKSSLTDNSNLYISDDFQEVYHFGVIDYLQKWDDSKKREFYFKTIIKG